ncbi:MAG: hypothetical protein QM664_12470 [Flavihumibacter sp.]
MKHDTLKTAVVFVFIFLFVYTAGSKWMDYARFKWVLEDSPLLAPFSSIIARGLPAVELLVAGLLLFPRTRKQGLLFTTILMGLFSFYIGYMLLTASSLPCSCGGVLRSMNWSQHLVFNLFLFLLALWSYCSYHPVRSLLRNSRE